MRTKSILLLSLIVIFFSNVCTWETAQGQAIQANEFDFSQLVELGSNSDLVIVAENQNIYAQALEEGYSAVYSNLQEAYDNATSDSVLILTPGTYESLYLRGHANDLVFIGFDATINKTPRDDPSDYSNACSLGVHYSSNITFKQITFRCNYVLGESSTDITIWNSSNVRFSNCVFSGNCESGLTITNSPDVSIYSCEFSGFTFDAIRVNDYDDTYWRSLNEPTSIVAEGNHIFDIPIPVSHPWDDFDPIEFFKNNDIYYSDTSEEIEHFDLTDIDLELPKEMIIIVSHDPELLVRATEEGYSGAFWYIRDAVDNAQQNSTIVVCPGKYVGFSIDFTVNSIEIIGYNAEIISNAPWPIIKLEYTSDISISGLSIHHGFEGYCLGGCIYICSSSDIQITSCDISGSGTFGIKINMSKDIFISDNLIHDCTYYGLVIDYYSSWFCSGDIRESENIIVTGNYFYGNPTDLENNQESVCINSDFYEVNEFQSPLSSK